MKNIKNFKNYINEEVGPSTDAEFLSPNEDVQLFEETEIDFEKEKEYLLKSLDKFMDEYDVFTKLVSPNYWRNTGHHFTELKKMKEDIKDFTEITTEEKEFASSIEEDEE